MCATRTQPFAGLTPEVVLDAAEAAGFGGEGRLFALNSYENRVYQLGPPGSAIVLKFYRPQRWSDVQILEEHAFALELARAELAVAAPLEVRGATLLHAGGFRFAAFGWQRGRAPELDAPGARQMLGRSLGRLHCIAAVRPFESRPALGVERLGWRAREGVLRSALLPAELADRYAAASESLLRQVERALGAAGPLRHIRLHGDCHLGNLLWSEQGPVFVDLDDCMSGPAIQDLWMLLSGTPDEQRGQWAQLLEGYQQFADFDFREVQLIEPLRALRMLHHAAWVAQRWDDPAFPRAFPWFAERRFWEEYTTDLRAQTLAIEDPPLLRGGEEDRA